MIHIEKNLRQKYKCISLKGFIFAVTKNGNALPIEINQLYYAIKRFIFIHKRFNFAYKQL